MSPAEPGKHLHGIRRHPDTRTHFGKPAAPLNDRHLVPTLLQGDCQGQPANPCSLNQDVAIFVRFHFAFRYTHVSIVRKLASNRSPFLLAF